MKHADRTVNIFIICHSQFKRICLFWTQLFLLLFCLKTWSMWSFQIHLVIMNCGYKLFSFQCSVNITIKHSIQCWRALYNAKHLHFCYFQDPVVLLSWYSAFWIIQKCIHSCSPVNLICISFWAFSLRFLKLCYRFKWVCIS